MVRLLVYGCHLDTLGLGYHAHTREGLVGTAVENVDRREGKAGTREGEVGTFHARVSHGGRYSFFYVD